MSPSYNFVFSFHSRIQSFYSRTPPRLTVAHKVDHPPPQFSMSSLIRSNFQSADPEYTLRREYKQTPAIFYSISVNLVKLQSVNNLSILNNFNLKNQPGYFHFRSQCFKLDLIFNPLRSFIQRPILNLLKSLIRKPITPRYPRLRENSKIFIHI